MAEGKVSEDTLRKFLQVYAVTASEALGVELDRIYVKGGEGPDGSVAVSLEIDGEKATEDQRELVKKHLTKSVVSDPLAN